MSEVPKLSVIVPIWGVEKYIEKCVRSLFESDLEDMEFIFVDDATPDNSIAVLQQVLDAYPARREQSVILHHEKNKGLPQARRTGFEVSRGEYITYCDSDDWVAPEMYSKMLALANNGGYDLVCCDFAYLNSDQILWKSNCENCNDPNQLRYDLLNLNLSNAVWNKIAHRKIYNEQMFYFPICSMDEDDVITCQLAFYAKNPGYVHECLYFHYANPESMTHVTDKDKQLRQWNEIIENRKWIINFLESKDEPNIKAGLFKLKYCVKQYISRITGRSSQKTYSEINLELLTSKILSSSHRISNFFFLYCYPLYSFKTKLFNWVKQHLAHNNTRQ